jgi:hypothetical protein
VVKYISQAVSKQVTLIIFCGIAINERVIVKPTQKKHLIDAATVIAKQSKDYRQHDGSKTIKWLSSI